MSDDVLHQLHLDLSSDLDRIAKRFKRPFLTLIVRNPDAGDADVVLTNDTDVDAVIASVKRFMRAEAKERKL